MTRLSNQPVQPPPRTRLTLILWLLACVFVPLWLAGCGGSDPEPPPPTEGSATIGAAGGIVTGPDGVQLALPADALANPVTFRIARDGSGAPSLEGINAASPVYAVTPHGQAFEAGSSFSIPLSAAQIPSGAEPLLLKAAPGGQWRVMSNTSTDPARLAADIHDLSYFVIGFCTSTPNDGWTVGAVDCPAAHRLELSLWNGSGERILRGNSAIPVPWMTITDTPRTLHMRLDWLRPDDIVRTDQLSVVGLPGGFRTGFTSTWPNPPVLDVPGRHSRSFSVTIDPAQVAGASAPNGRVLRIRAYASYGTTAFRIGVGNIPVGFEFMTEIPILVRYTGALLLPTISQQPASVGVTEGQPAGFTVSASISPASTLSYQWSRRASASAAFAPIPGASAASYSLATTALADHGAEFQVQVCAGPTRCVVSNVATLSVTQTPVAPVFTTAPLDQMVVTGQTANFLVIATGVPLPQIRWQRAPAGSTSFTDITGVPTCGTTPPMRNFTTHVVASCIVGPLAMADSGQRYRAVASSSAAPGGVTSSFATVTVNAAAVAPAITAQPAPQSTTVGGSASFSVTASGTAPLAYAWRNMPSVSGEFAFTAPSGGECRGTVTYSNGGSTITLSGLSTGCNGVQVGVTVSNGVNPNAVSNGVTLTVNQAVSSGACFAGQSSWCYANPSPQAGGLNGLTYDPSTSSFTAVGPSGTTLRTGDGGTTWQLAFETGRTYFTDVASPASGLLVAVGLPPLGSGQNAGVFSSTDNGRNWTRRLDAGFPGQFAVTKLAFANASVGLAAGARGLWRTTNGGMNWTAVPSVPDADFVVSTHHGGVAWVDTNVVLIYGSGGKILRSADQGVSWTDVSPAGFVDDWSDMAFNAVGIGIAVGPSGRVARSTDGGASWQEVVTPLSSPGTAVAFANANTAVVMGNTGQTMRSTDAGATWTAGFAFSASAFYRLRFSSPTVGLAVSAVNGLTLRTTDGGETWTRIGGGTIDENVVGMAASPSGNVVLAGSLGRAMLRSADGGATWLRSGSFPVGAQFQKPAFATEQRAIAIRPEGQIVLSVDAGQTWSIADDRLGRVRLTDATMASATLGLVVGDNGLILRSTDGGSSWAAVTSGTSVQLKAVRCLTATVCVAGGGGLLRSTDGGATWAVLPSLGNTFGANAIARWSDSVAVITSSDGLWRSADAGLTWTRVYVPTGGSQLGVSFNAAGIGIATGYDGILRSTNQGLTWAPQAVPAPSYLNAVVWVSATTVLVGGDGGAILRNLQAGAE